MDAQVHGASAAQVLGEVRADFWRCYNCKRLITKPEMDRALGVDGTGIACPCQSSRYTPANVPWYGFLIPRVLRFGFDRLRGKA